MAGLLRTRRLERERRRAVVIAGDDSVCWLAMHRVGQTGHRATRGKRSGPVRVVLADHDARERATRVLVYGDLAASPRPGYCGRRGVAPFRTRRRTGRLGSRPGARRRRGDSGRARRDAGAVLRGPCHRPDDDQHDRGKHGAYEHRHDPPDRLPHGRPAGCCMREIFAAAMCARRTACRPARPCERLRPGIRRRAWRRCSGCASRPSCG